MRRYFRHATMKQKMMFGFFILFAILLLILYRGLYLNTMDVMKRKAEDSIYTISDQTATQIDKSFGHMVTISHIFISDRRNRELLQIENLSDVDQVRNYWKLQETMNTLSGYFSDYHVAIYLQKESILAQDRVRFFGDDLSFEENIVDMALLSKGELIWTYDNEIYDMNNQAIQAVSAYRFINTPSHQTKDNQIFRASISFQTIEKIFSASTVSMPIKYFILDRESNVVIKSANITDHSMVSFTSEISEVVIDSEEHYLTYLEMPTNRWTLVTAIPIDYYSETTIEYQTFFVIIIVVLFLSFMAVMMIIWRSFDTRVNRIIEILDDIEKEDYSQQINIIEQDELSRIENKMNEFIYRIQLLMKNIIRIEDEKKKSELVSLQAQIKPHFLYNALDSINWMALEKGHYEISEAIVDLADFMRKSLSAADDYVLVGDELEHVRLYVKIMSDRSEYKVTLKEDVPDQLLKINCLRFLLQPIVENSLIHGFSKNHRTQGCIIINGRIEDGQVVINIADDGDGFDTNLVTSEAYGYGLKNVENRLKLFYGESSDLSIISRVKKGTVVRLTWPY